MLVIAVPSCRGLQSSVQFFPSPRVQLPGSKSLSEAELPILCTILVSLVLTEMFLGLPRVETLVAFDTYNVCHYRHPTKRLAKNLYRTLEDVFSRE